MDHAGGGSGLAGHVGIGVLTDDGVQHSVGNLVADLVGMALGDGFRGEQFHYYFPFQYLSG